MTSMKKGNSVFMTADSEELDYEGDDVPAKKFSPITFEEEKDVEEGEILDADDRDLICFFYQSGKCAAGDKCHFLHVTDKSLYKMFDSPPSSSKFWNVDLSYNIWKECEEASSAWDRALLEAKRLIKEKDLRVKTPHSPVINTIDSDDEPFSAQKPCRYRSPELLPHKASLFDSYTKSPEHKSVRHAWCREVKWHDPWRRSPIGYSKSSAVSSKCRRKKSSTSSSSSECKVHFKKQNSSRNIKNRRKVRSSQSSSSLSPILTRYSRKEKFIKDSKMQEKKVVPFLEKNPKAVEHVQKSLNISSTSDKKKVAQEKKFAPFAIKKLNKSPKIIECPKENSPNISLISDKDIKLQCMRQGKETLPSFDNKLLKPTEFDKKKLSLLNLPASHQSNTVCMRTPKKIQSSTPVQSCSDMSISPLSDSSLSDLFDPDKKAGKMERSLQASSFLAHKTCQVKDNTSVMPKENKVANSFQGNSEINRNDELETIEDSKLKTNSLKCDIVNKAVNLPKPKVVKKCNINSLEDDLLKFQRGNRLMKKVQSDPTKPSEVVENQASKEDSIPQNQKVEESEKVKRPGETPITRLSRREMLLKQLEAINAAIERKKKLCGNTK